MAIKFTPVSENGLVFHSNKYWKVTPGKAPERDGNVMVTANPPSIHGTFKSVTRTGEGTSALLTPLESGSLLITDFIISGEKQVGSTVELRFTDDTNTETLFLANQVDAPAQIAHAFQGRVQGWRDARLDIITAGTADATVLVCYVKLIDSVPYAEWNALR